MSKLLESRMTLILVLLIITLLGGILRLTYLDKNPVSLSVDEASIGYNAYSILKTGKDEYGNFLPLSFKSLGDYKPPLYTYLVAVSEGVFGLNEFSVRLPSAIIGTFSIFLSGLLLLLLFGEKRYAVVGSLLVAISAWHIHISRLGWEYMTGTSLVVAGAFSLLKMLGGKWYWSVTAALALVLSMYAYHAQRLFVPLFILSFLILYRNQLIKIKKQVLIFLVLCAILVTPLFLSVLLGPDKTRAQMTFITKDVDFHRYVAVSPAYQPVGISAFFGSEYLLLFFYWARKLLAYFQPSFLFSNGLLLTVTGSYGLGVLYLFQVPLLIAGLVALFKKHITHRKLIISWMLLGLLPASLTINEQHYGRSFIIFPALIAIVTLGTVYLWDVISKLKVFYRSAIVVIFTGLIIWNLIEAVLIYSIHFPRQKGEDFMEGTKQSVQYALTLKDQYQDIIFDPVRGIDGPFIVNAPHIYVLFYSQYDPAAYLKIPKRIEGESYGFDKFTIRKIDWVKDQYKEHTLFVGSPWSFPLNSLSQEKILKKIYLSNGKLALVIVAND